MSETFEQYLRRLTELNRAALATDAVQALIREAGFPVQKDFTFDFTAVPQLSKPTLLQLAQGAWIEQRASAYFIGSPGTGKTHLATALGVTACCRGKRVRFFTAAELVGGLAVARKKHQLDRVLAQLDETDLLICDELGYLSFSRAGAKLLFQVLAARSERRSLLVTSTLAFSEWGRVFFGGRGWEPRKVRLTQRCLILEMNGRSGRCQESM
jgi:DNA replication protein DnaC